MKGPQKQNINQNHQCSICLDVYYKPVEIRICKHVFCDNCLNQAAVIKGTHQCPLCRAVFKPGDLKEQVEFWNQLKLLYPQNIHRKEKNIMERVIVRFAIGNRTEFLQTNEDNKYVWSLFMEQAEGGLPLSEMMEKVVVKLHPTFTPKEIEFNMANKQSVSLQRTGWGTFRINIKVVWKGKFNEKESEFHHDLEFVAETRRVVQTYLTLKK